MTYQWRCQDAWQHDGLAGSPEGSAEKRSRRHCPRLSGVEPRPPLTKREDARVFMLIAAPIFVVTILIATLVVVLGTR